MPVDLAEDQRADQVLNCAKLFIEESENAQRGHCQGQVNPLP